MLTLAAVDLCLYKEKRSESARNLQRPSASSLNKLFGSTAAERQERAVEEKAPVVQGEAGEALGTAAVHVQINQAPEVGEDATFARRTQAPAARAQAFDTPRTHSSARNSDPQGQRQRRQRRGEGALLGLQFCQQSRGDAENIRPC